ncbi:hypothetical protein COBT_003096, partial [Conglomerata obtusa]
QECKFITIINGNVDFNIYGKEFERFYKQNEGAIGASYENTDEYKENQEEDSEHYT